MDPRKPIFDRSKLVPKKALGDPEERWLNEQFAARNTLRFTFSNGRTVEGKILDIRRFSLVIGQPGPRHILIWKQGLETTEIVAESAGQSGVR